MRASEREREARGWREGGRCPPFVLRGSQKKKCTAFLRFAREEEEKGHFFLGPAYCSFPVISLFLACPHPLRATAQNKTKK